MVGFRPESRVGLTSSVVKSRSTPPPFYLSLARTAPTSSVMILAGFTQDPRLGFGDRPKNRRIKWESVGQRVDHPSDAVIDL